MISWKTLQSNLLSDITSISFVNNFRGYICTSDGKVLKTIDGGLTWDNLNTNSLSFLHSITFPINEQIGYVAGDNGTILKTEDGGMTWISLNSTTNNNLLSIFFLDNLHGYVAGNNGTILKTEDGGQTWISISNNNLLTFNFRSIFFASLQIGYIAGENGIIIKTIDNGQNWDILSATGSNWNDIYFLDTNTGYFIGDNGTAIRTDDGAITTSSIDLNTTKNLNAIIFPVDEQVGYIAGNDIILKLNNISGKIVQIIFSDDFNDNSLDVNKWIVAPDSPNIYTVNEINQQIEIHANTATASGGISLIVNMQEDLSLNEYLIEADFNIATNDNVLIGLFLQSISDSTVRASIILGFIVNGGPIASSYEGINGQEPGPELNIIPEKVRININNGKVFYHFVNNNITLEGPTIPSNSYYIIIRAEKQFTTSFDATIDNFIVQKTSINPSNIIENILLDDFNDNNLDLMKWFPFSDDISASSIQEINQHIEISSNSLNPDISSGIIYITTHDYSSEKYTIQVDLDLTPQLGEIMCVCAINSLVIPTPILIVGLISPLNDASVYGIYSGTGGFNDMMMTPSPIIHPDTIQITIDNGAVSYNFLNNNLQFNGPTIASDNYMVSFVGRQTTPSTQLNAIIDNVSIDKLPLAPPAPQISSFSDDFNDNILDTNKWDIYKGSPASSFIAQEINQHLEFTGIADFNGAFIEARTKNLNFNFVTGTHFISADIDILNITTNGFFAAVLSIQDNNLPDPIIIAGLVSLPGENFIRPAYFGTGGTQDLQFGLQITTPETVKITISDGIISYDFINNGLHFDGYTLSPTSLTTQEVFLHSGQDVQGEPLFTIFDNVSVSIPNQSLPVEEQTVPIHQNFLDISFPEDNITGYIAGTSGSIMKYSEIEGANFNLINEPASNQAILSWNIPSLILFSDNFNDNNLDLTKWNITNLDPNFTIQEISNRLEINGHAGEVKISSIAGEDFSSGTYFIEADLLIASNFPLVSAPLVSILVSDSNLGTVAEIGLQSTASTNIQAFTNDMDNGFQISNALSAPNETIRITIQNGNIQFDFLKNSIHFNGPIVSFSNQSEIIIKVSETANQQDSQARAIIDNVKILKQVDDISGYNIYRSQAIDGPFIKINTSLVQNIDYIDLGLQNDISYFYYIRHVNTQNIEIYRSNILEIIPSIVPWTKKFESVDPPLFSVDFPENDQIGYAAGFRRILKTIDGGDTWNTIFPLQGSSSFGDTIRRNISFLNNNIGYILIQDDSAYKTINGGDTWQQIQFNIPFSNSNVIFFLNEFTGYIGGHNGFLIKTIDGGTTWSDASNGLGTSFILDFFFITENIGYLTTANSEIFKTIDGGQNWVLQNSGVSIRLNSIYFVNEQIGFIVGNGVILNTLDGGNTWNILQIGINLNSIYFPIDEQVGYAVGDEGKIIRTTNGGTNWYFIESPTTDNLYALSFPSGNEIGFAAGGNSSVIISTPSAFSLPALIPPEPPINLEVSNIGKQTIQVQLQWQNNPNNIIPIIGYNIYRASLIDGPYHKIANLVQDLNYIDNISTNLSEIEYFYSVKAIGNNNIESNFSNIVSIIPRLIVSNILSILFSIRPICSTASIQFDIQRKIERIKYGMQFQYGAGIHYGDSINKTSGINSFLESVRSDIIEGSPRNILIPDEPINVKDEVYRDSNSHYINIEWDRIVKSQQQYLKPLFKKPECCCPLGIKGIEYQEFYHPQLAHRDPILLLGKFYKNLKGRMIQPTNYPKNKFFEFPVDSLLPILLFGGFSYKNQILPAFVRILTDFQVYDNTLSDTFPTWRISSIGENIIEFSRELQDDDTVTMDVFLSSFFWADRDLFEQGLPSEFHSFDDDNIIYQQDNGIVYIPLSFTEGIESQIEQEKLNLFPEEDILLEARTTFFQNFKLFLDPILKYNIYKETRSKFNSAFVIHHTNEPSFKDEDIAGGISIFYQITGQVNDGLQEEGNFSDKLEIHTIPDSVLNLRATLFFGEILLEWDPVPDNPNILGFHIYRSIDDGIFERLTNNPVVEERFLDNDIQENHIYKYRVTAVDNSNQYDFIEGDKILSSKYKLRR